MADILIVSYDLKAVLRTQKVISIYQTIDQLQSS